MTISRAARLRSLIGLLLALPLAALIAGIFACLPVPLGDPEKSKIDPSLTGGWIVAGEDKKTTLYLVQPFDNHTYLIQSLDFETNADKSIKPNKMITMKGWLATIADKTFITAMPLALGETLQPEAGDDKDKKVYFVAAITVKADTLELAPMKADHELLKNLKTTAEAEKVIKDNINNGEIYDKALTLKKVGKDQAENTKAILKAFNMD